MLEDILQTFQELQLDRENLLTSNRGLAEVSLTQRPHLDSGKLQLSHKYQELSNLATSCWEKQSRLGEIHRWILRCLGELKLPMMHCNTELLEKFMDGLLPLDDFLDSFQRSRRSCHVRRAQAEKLQELSRRNEEKPDCEAPHRPNGLPLPRARPLRARPTGPAQSLPGALRPDSGHPGAALPPSVSARPGPRAAALPPTMGLRLIGQLPGGWASGRPVRVQQLYRPSPPTPSRPVDKRVSLPQGDPA
uniref:Si:ch211-284f22.3 n=1 Tax=Neogobius melanostomus TaxID=47308 RepID=A0A8C6WMP1_9GOBI